VNSVLGLWVGIQSIFVETGSRMPNMFHGPRTPGTVILYVKFMVKL
jgi:hypothetical protein